VEPTTGLPLLRLGFPKLYEVEPTTGFEPVTC
jgi:hypothetical protein